MPYFTPFYHCYAQKNLSAQKIFFSSAKKNSGHEPYSDLCPEKIFCFLKKGECQLMFDICDANAVPNSAMKIIDSTTAIADMISVALA